MAIYTTQDEVKAILRSLGSIKQGGNPIDFSGSYLNLRLDPNSPSVVDKILPRPRLVQIDFADSWKGGAEFELVFSDTTAFDAHFVPEGNAIPADLGSGTIAGTFTATDPYGNGDDIYTLLPQYWSGLFQDGDRIVFESQVVLSNDDLETIIEDAQDAVDSWILSHPSKRVVLQDLTQQIWTNPALVPKRAKLATKYMAAFLAVAWVTPAADLSKSGAFQWWKMAQSYAISVVEEIAPKAPYIVTRPGVVATSEFDSIGSPNYGMLDSVARVQLGVNSLGLAEIKRQSVGVTLLDVIDRLRKYKKDFNAIDYVSELA